MVNDTLRLAAGFFITNSGPADADRRLSNAERRFRGGSGRIGVGGCEVVLLSSLSFFSPCFHV